MRTRKPKILEYYPIAKGYPKGKPASNKRITILTDFQIDNFWNKVKKSRGCWNWIGWKNSLGRGQLKLWGEGFVAARVSYALEFNIDPGPWSCCHKCDNPSCVNPKHLWLASHQDNVDDMHKKDRFIASLGNTKIYSGSEEEKLLLDTSIPTTVVASILNIHRRTVWQHRKRLGLGSTTPGRKPDVWNKNGPN